MLTRILYAIFGFGAMLFFYLGYATENALFNYMAVPLFVGLVVTYVMSPQIDWWYYQKNPPTLDGRTKEWLTKSLPFYNALGEAGKQRFEQRMALFPNAHEFMPMHVDSLPQEVQLVIAASAVHLTFGQADFLLEPYEKLVVYPSSFLSPRYPKHMHSSEIHPEDGALIFSARHLMHGFLQPKQYYNTALHECVQAWIQLNPNRRYPTLGDDIWETLAQISTYKKESVYEWIGLPAIDTMAVSICHFLVFPARFQEVAPALYTQFSELLNLNPLEGEQPIVYINQG